MKKQVIICDVCGEQINGEHNTFTVNIIAHVFMSTSPNKRQVCVGDVCKKCTLSILKTMNLPVETLIKE